MKILFIATVLIGAGFISGLKAQVIIPDSLQDAGRNLYQQAKYGQAADLYEKAAKTYLLEGDSLNWANAILRQGDALMNRGEVQKGLDLFLLVNTNLPKNADAVLKAKTNQHLGRIYRELEQYEQSKKYYLEGIAFANTSGDSVLIATLNNNISYPYLYSGNYEAALFHQKKARELYETTGKTHELSFVLNGIFATLNDLGLHTQAHKYIRQSLVLREEIGNPNLLDVAYHNMAVSFNAIGKPDSAIIYYQKSLELSRKLGNPYDITQTLISIGSLYERSGEYDNALAYYNEALETNYQTDRPVSIAKNLMRLAEVAILNNDLNNAETFYQEALTWMEKANAPQNLADIYLNFAELKLEQGHHAQAKKYVADAKSISRENFTAQRYQAHHVLGEIYKAESKLHESLEEYHQAYDLYSNRGISSKISPTINLARAYNQIYSDSAFMYAEKAFSLIDSIRTNVAGLTFRSGYFREYAGFYNEVASWYITQKNDPEKAFELVEAAKARVLMDELAEASEKVYETLDETTLIKKQQKAKQIDRLYNQLSGAVTEQDKNALHNEIKDLEFQYQSFLNQIAASDPRLKDFKYPKPVTLQRVQEILDPETAILEYAFSDSKLIRLFITQKNITGTLIENTELSQSLTEQIIAYRESITQKKSTVHLRELGEELQSILIPDLSASNLNRVKNLLIIPDGSLTFLPFESLNLDNRHLIEDFYIKYLPSASIYFHIKAPHRTTKFELLALAGSGFEGRSNVAVSSSSQTSFASLPSTLLEVDSIAVNFTSAKILKNDDVTEAGLKSHNLADFRFIHFATHAEVNESNPSQSGLLLSKKTDVESLFGEDGYLNSREISGFRLNADLVTLSACNTGMGKVVTGEGLLGLQRSFLSAGASSVMVSLWSVFDRSTSVFMSTFYKQMLAHEELDYGLWSQTLDWLGMYEHPLFDYKAKALRDAKLAMIDHPYYNHPVYWAPFILVGK